MSIFYCTHNPNPNFILHLQKNN